MPRLHALDSPRRAPALLRGNSRRYDRGRTQQSASLPYGLTEESLRASRCSSGTCSRSVIALPPLDYDFVNESSEFETWTSSGGLRDSLRPPRPGGRRFSRARPRRLAEVRPGSRCNGPIGALDGRRCERSSGSGGARSVLPTRRTPTTRSGRFRPYAEDPVNKGARARGSPRRGTWPKRTR